MATRKVPVTVTYTHHAAQPPIFLAGSFSDPAWRPQEMDFTKDDAGEFHFHKEVSVEAGSEYQYKFRIGPGEWWVLDETAPTVTDALGNRNNLLVAPVEEDQKEESSPQKSTDGPRESIGDIQISTLIVEKTDAEPNHSDDFGNNTATVGQKEAHDMRAPDAEPVATIVKTHKPLPAETKDIAKPEDAALTTDGKGSSPQSPDAELSILEERRLSHTPIPEVAATAAEVADSAAKIDREESLEATTDAETSTPPGLHNIFAALEARRLSHTPIGEVADTAAEVADSAAEIDREMVDNHEFAKALPRFHFPPETGTESGAATPANEQPPLFAHERFEPYDGEEREIGPSPVPSPSEHEYEQPDEEIDTNDPTLEEFPEDMSSILTHIRSTESRLGADQTDYNPLTGSPANDPTESNEKELSDPNPNRFDPQPSLSLDKIEESEEEQKVNDSKSSNRKDIDDNTTTISISGTDGGEDIAEPLQPGGNLKIISDTVAAASQHSMGDSPSTIVTTLPSSAVDPPSLLEEVEAMPVPNESILDHITVEAPDSESIPALQTLGPIISPESSAPTSADQKDITVNNLTANDDADINGNHSLEECETMASQVSVKGGGDDKMPSPGIEKAEAALISKGAMEASNDSAESPKPAEDVTGPRQSTGLTKLTEVQKETSGPSPVEDAPIGHELQLKSVEAEESPVDLQQETVSSIGQAKAIYGDEPSATVENSQVRDEPPTKKISVGQLHPSKGAEINSTTEELSQVETRDTHKGSLPDVEEVQAFVEQKPPARDSQTKTSADELKQINTDTTESEAGLSAATDESQSKPVGIESTSPELANTGNATDLDNDSANGTSGPTKRNQVSERSSESSSQHSTTKEPQHQSFISFVWQKVFVGWIGGLFKKLFGGERRQ